MTEELTEEFYDDGPKKEVSIADMQRLICRYVDARSEYDTLKEQASAQHKEVEKLKAEIIQELTESGLRKFDVPGVGSISKVVSMVYPTPKDITAKKQLFEFLEREYGEEGFLAYASINHQTLNSLCKKLVEDGVAIIPGVELPKEEINIRFNKERV